MGIYWKEQCDYCTNQNCGYKEDVKSYIERLTKLDKETKNVFGSLRFSCDYFYLDKERYVMKEIIKAIDCPIQKER